MIRMTNRREGRRTVTSCGPDVRIDSHSHLCLDPRPDRCLRPSPLRSSCPDHRRFLSSQHQRPLDSSIDESPANPGSARKEYTQPMITNNCLTAIFCALAASMTPLYAESVQPSEGKAQSDIDMIFQSPLNAEFIEKMLPLVKGNPKEALVKIPADRGGIAMAQKWGSIYVTRSLFKQYVRHKSAIHAKAGALAREEVQKLNIKNESEAAVELKKQTAKSMPISLGQAMEEMKDPRERLLLFCMCRTSHGYEKGYGLMSWVPDEEVRAAIPDALFKTVIRDDGEKLHTFTVLILNILPKTESDYKSYITPIDRIEDLTGLDFLTITYKVISTVVLAV